MRIMGLDFGSKTVGVAVSDPLLVTAQSIETIFRKSPHKLRQTLSRIDELVAEYEVEKIVITGLSFLHIYWKFTLIYSLSISSTNSSRSTFMTMLLALL